MYVVHRTNNSSATKPGIVSASIMSRLSYGIHRVDVGGASTKRTLPSYTLLLPSHPPPSKIHLPQNRITGNNASSRYHGAPVLTQTNPFSSNKMFQGEWAHTFGSEESSDNRDGGKETPRLNCLSSWPFSFPYFHTHRVGTMCQRLVFVPSLSSL